MASVLVSLSNKSFEVQGNQFVFITPALYYPAISSAHTFIETVWPEPLSLSTLMISVSDANDLSPTFSSRKVLLLHLQLRQLLC